MTGGAINDGPIAGDLRLEVGSNRTGIENHLRLRFDFSPTPRDAPNNVEEAVKWLRAKAEAEAPDSMSWWRWVDARAALRRLRRDYA